MDDNYAYTKYKRNDILNNIHSTSNDIKKTNDIIGFIEKRIAYSVKNREAIQLPYIGNISVDRNYVDVMEHSAELKEAASVLNTDKYKAYKWNLAKSQILKRKRIDKYFRDNITLANKFKRVKRKLKLTGLPDYAVNYYCAKLNYLKPIKATIDE